MFFYFNFYFLRGIHSVVGSNLCERKWKSFHPIYNKVLLIEHVYNYRHEHILLLGVQQVLMVMAFIKAYMKRTSKENATRRRRQKKKNRIIDEGTWQGTLRVKRWYAVFGLIILWSPRVLCWFIFVCSCYRTVVARCVMYHVYCNLSS